MSGGDGSGEGHCCDRGDSCEHLGGGVREGEVCWEGVRGRVNLRRWMDIGKYFECRNRNRGIGGWKGERYVP